MSKKNNTRSSTGAGDNINSTFMKKPVLSAEDTKSTPVSDKNKPPIARLNETVAMQAQQIEELFSLLKVSPNATDLSQKVDKQGTIINTLTKSMDGISALEAKVKIHGDQLSSLVTELSKRDKIIDSTFQSLEKRICRLEGELQLANSKMFVMDRVSNELRNQLVDAQQYSRRYSCILAGIDKPYNESPQSLKAEVSKVICAANSPVTLADVDKFHRNGPIDGNKQEIIVRFKSHAAKESFYKERKTIETTAKIRPSLAPERKRLLNESINFIKEVYADSNMENPPDFVYADVHGNLKLKMSKKTKKGFFFNFNSIEQLRFLINVNQEYLDRPPVKDRANEADDDDMGFGAFC